MRGWGFCFADLGNIWFVFGSFGWRDRLGLRDLGKELGGLRVRDIGVCVCFSR